MTTWWSGKLMRWWNNQLSKWQVNEMTNWWNYKSIFWQIDEIASWQIDKLTKWQVDKMTSWCNLINIVSCLNLGWRVLVPAWRLAGQSTPGCSPTPWWRKCKMKLKNRFVNRFQTSLMCRELCLHRKAVVI